MVSEARSINNSRQHLCYFLSDSLAEVLKDLLVKVLGDVFVAYLKAISFLESIKFSRLKADLTCDFSLVKVSCESPNSFENQVLSNILGVLFLERRHFVENHLVKTPLVTGVDS